MDDRTRRELIMLTALALDTTSAYLKLRYLNESQLLGTRLEDLPLLKAPAKKPGRKKKK